MNRIDRLAVAIVDRVPRDRGKHWTEPDCNSFGIFTHGDQVEIVFGRDDLITFTISRKTALQAARWLIVDCWARGTWLGIRSIVFGWAMRRLARRSGWRSVRS